jgi:hypothetical protein
LRGKPFECPDCVDNRYLREYGPGIPVYFGKGGGRL